MFLTLLNTQFDAEIKVTQYFSLHNVGVYDMNAQSVIYQILSTRDVEYTITNSMKIVKNRSNLNLFEPFYRWKRKLVVINFLGIIISLLTTIADHRVDLVQVTVILKFK